MLPIALAGSLSAFAALTGVFVDQRQDMDSVNASGGVGPYERIVGTAVYDDGSRVEYSVAKPRDPTKSNGVLVVLVGARVGSDTLMNRGYTLLRLKTVDPAAIRDFVSYVRYGRMRVRGFGLGDQPAFLKRALIVGSAGSVESIVSNGANAEGKPYFEGAIITEKRSFKAPPPLKMMQAKPRPEETVLQLDRELGPPAK